MKRLLRIEIALNESDNSLNAMIGTNDYEELNFDNLCENFFVDVCDLFESRREVKTQIKGV